MTFEELKAEAARQGYKIVFTLEKCPLCGKTPQKWYVEHGGRDGKRLYIYQCCRYRAEATGMRQAQAEWNSLIRVVTKDDE